MLIGDDFLDNFARLEIHLVKLFVRILVKKYQFGVLIVELELFGGDSVLVEALQRWKVADFAEKSAKLQ